MLGLIIEGSQLSLLLINRDQMMGKCVVTVKTNLDINSRSSKDFKNWKTQSDIVD